jgi:hypothetical protein
MNFFFPWDRRGLLYLAIGGIRKRGNENKLKLIQYLKSDSPNPFQLILKTYFEKL